ncbi:MAG: potassium transporter peripheral membrane component [Cycloclasticus sp. symbiont of Poecilosclerida sp. M]|nr:MAG: potassium transporter peripheral membrane component [Cycloclasticus sp. symbiont of Poecilosclerida sp. M]
MRIIILGAGQVGFTVANNLAHEDIDITLVDTDQSVINAACEHLDIATICGNATHPDVLESAGIKQADMIIAATDSDECNIMACQIAHHLFQVPKKIARIRAQAFLKVKDQLFNSETIPIDVIINPEEEIVEFIKSLILHPGAQQVLSFADDSLSLVETNVKAGHEIIGSSLKEMTQMLGGLEARIAAIFRNGSIVIPNFDTEVQAGDRLFFIAPSKDIQEVLRIIFNQNKHYKSVTIAGGGRIGLGLAKALENELQVKIITKSPDKAHRLSEQLDNTIVLSGDATDEALLLDENIDRTDVFCTVTNDDETNILCAMLAKSLGAQTVMSLVDRTAYMSLVDNGSIDNAIYPQHTTIGRILTLIRRGSISRVHSLLRGKAEAFEATIQDNGTKSTIAGKQIKDIKLPASAIIIGVVREGQPILAKNELILIGGDHVIVFVTDKTTIRTVEALFQPPKSLIGKLNAL